MIEPISCNLAENAIDYLLLAGEQAKEGSPRMIKHSLATLADGIELLLKSRLELKDWCLLFKDVDQATRQKYESGDFQSVVFDQAVNRLENLCSVSIATNHLLIIKELRQARNRIRHFAVSIDKSAAISVIVKTFSFAVSFVANHLQHVHEALEYELADLRTMLGEFEEFVDERMAEIQPQLEKAFRVIDCPVCLQAALKLGSGEAECLFCCHKTSGESAASQWADQFLGFQSMKDSMIEPRIKSCPSCGAEACVDTSAHTDGRNGFVCFECGEGGDYEECISCGNLCYEDAGACDDCRDHFMNDGDDDDE